MTQYPTLHMIIDGEKVSGGGRRTFDVVNPVTGEPIGALPLAEPADLDRALDVAEKGFAIWRKSTPQQRAAAHGQLPPSEKPSAAFSCANTPYTCRRFSALSACALSP